MSESPHQPFLDKLAPDVRSKLEAIQAQILSLLPQATPCVGYNMPAYRGKRIFFYFWAFKKHIGIYPPVKADKQLIAELAPYRGPKGNLSFPLSKPLPVELIGRVALTLYQEYGHSKS
jgi:uncharacterized protein YdhG (YjbR/CyaY superfamily)